MMGMSRSIVFGLVLAAILSACGGEAPATTAGGSAGDTATSQPASAGAAGTETTPASEPASAETAAVETTPASEPEVSTSESGADSIPAGGSAGGAGGTAGQCLTAEEVSDIVGVPLRVFEEGTQSAGDRWVCAYLNTGAEINTTVSLAVLPASESNAEFADLQDAAKTLLGQDAEAEAIDVGEGGFAFESMDTSEAAAVAGGRVYHVELGEVGQANIANKKEVAIQLLRRMIG